MKITIKSSTLIVLFLIVVRITGNSQSTATASIEPWLGCYELRTTTVKAKGEKTYPVFPRHLRLLATPVFEGNFAVRILDRQYDWLITLWKPNDDNELTIVFGTGFDGYTLTVRRSENALLGTVQFFSDTGADDEIPGMKVRLRSISCSSLEPTAHAQRH